MAVAERAVKLDARPRTAPPWRALGLVVASLTLLGGSPAAATTPPPQTLTVFAAASLRETFGELGRRFEAAHPGTKVTLNFAGSQELRTQIEQGAPADVFASADRAHVDALERQKLVLASTCFAQNEPVIAVPLGNPMSLRGLEDLPRVHQLVLGAPEVPIGRYSDQILELGKQRFGPAWATAVHMAIASRELDVRQVLTKIQLGEADAGIVYRTDARVAATTIQPIAIPAELNVRANDTIAVVQGSAHPALARQWVEFVRSPEGRRVFLEAGFLPPSPPGEAGPK